MAPEEAYQRARTASVEGRLENVLERQKQLAALHKLLKRKADVVAKALENDHGVPTDQALIEVGVALDLIKQLYDGLDFPSSLKAERALKAGASVSRRLFAVGLVLVVGGSFSPFGSIVAPLAAAIAAGCSVLVLPSSAAPSLEFVLHEILTEALDKEAVVVVSDQDGRTLQEVAQLHFAAASFPDKESSLAMRDALRRTNPSIRLLEPSDGLPVVIVDRSSTDLGAVAEHIGRAVLGSAPLNRLRAPRLCLVDEFAIKELAGHLQDATSTLSHGHDDRKRRSELGRALRERFPSLAEKLKRDDIHSVPPIITLDETDSPTHENLEYIARLLTLHGRELLLVPTKSLDHAIDLVNGLNATSPGQAMYLFGEARESFYLSTFIDCQHVFVNHIPPKSAAVIASSSIHDSYELPYRVEDFSKGRVTVQQRLISPARETFSRHRVLNSELSAKKIYQPQGGMFSFFIQGVMIGVSVVVVSVGTLAYTGYNMLSK